MGLLLVMWSRWRLCEPYSPEVPFLCGEISWVISRVIVGSADDGNGITTVVGTDKRRKNSLYSEQIH